MSDTIKSFIMKFLERTVIIIMLLMTIVVFSGIVCRFFKVPLVWAEEFALICMIWMTFLGAAMLYPVYGHMGVDILVNQFPLKYRKIVEIITEIALIPLFATIIYGGIKLVGVTWKSITPGLKITVAIQYIPPVVGGMLLLMFSIDRIINDIKKLREISKEEVVSNKGVEAEW